MWKHVTLCVSVTHKLTSKQGSHCIELQSVHLTINMSVCVTTPLLFTIVTRGLGAVFTLGKGSSSSKVGKLVGKITKKSETQKIIIKIRVTLHDNTETLHVTTGWC